MPECRHAAVGPRAKVPPIAAAAMSVDAMATPICRPRTPNTIAAIARRASRMTTARHVPGAVSRGRIPNPPVSEPTIAPAVFQAYVKPTWRPTCS